MKHITQLTLAKFQQITHPRLAVTSWFACWLFWPNPSSQLQSVSGYLSDVYRALRLGVPTEMKSKHLRKVHLKFVPVSFPYMYMFLVCVPMFLLPLSSAKGQKVDHFFKAAVGGVLDMHWSFDRWRLDYVPRCSR